MGSTSGLASLAKWRGGIAPQRAIPAFAATTFQQQMRHRPSNKAEQPQVVLFPDTFNNHFFPNTALAAVDVLEAAGYQVQMPMRPRREQIAQCTGRQAIHPAELLARSLKSNHGAAH